MTKRLLYCFSLIAGTSSLLAQDPAGCTDAHLQGAYAISISGTGPAPFAAPGIAALPGTPEQFIGVILTTFDGKGAFTQLDFVKGTVRGYPAPRPGKGVYKVNPDCTGTYTIQLPVAPFEIVAQFILIDSGAAFTGLVTTPLPNMTAISARRVR